MALKVVLIAPPIMDYVGGRSWGRLRPIAMDSSRECPPYGIYMLASAVRAAGHEVVLIDLIARGSRVIKPFRADIEDCALIGVGATSMSWPTGHDIIRQLRQIRDDVPIVMGGIHPTMFDRYLLTNFDIQFIIRGEGEAALPALCDALERRADLRSVPNLSWRTPDGQVVRNPLAPKIGKSSLATFPLPDYSDLPEGIYKGLAIESSRGCAFDCSFCSTSYRLSWRGMETAQFVDRLESISAHLSRTRLRTIHIIDDEFSMNPRRATEIAKEIHARGLHPKLVYDSRANDLLYEGYVENIADLTCQFLVGAECGYDEGLKLVGKGTTCDALERAARKLHQFGISERADFSFILGLPWESRTEIEKTIRFAMHLHGNYGVRILLQWYCQIPGSRLWDDAQARGLVNEAMYNDYGFFRDLYLFRSGVTLDPREIWEIADMIEQLRWVASLNSPKRQMIEFAFPAAIDNGFPREVLGDRSGGLASLREVARPERQVSEAHGEPLHDQPLQIGKRTPLTPTPIRVGIPRRHFPETAD